MVQRERYNAKSAVRWLSGRKRPPAKWVGEFLPSRVRISISPPACLALAFLLALPAASFGQSLDEYLKLRRQYKVSQPTTTAALESFVGSRVLEIRGVVKGSMSGPGGNLVLVETADGRTLDIGAKAVPDWMLAGEVPARLLVQAKRASETDDLDALMLGARPDGDLIKYDPKPSKASPKKSWAPLRGPIGPSRGGVSRRDVPRNWNLPASDAVPYYAAFAKRENPRLSDTEASKIAQGVIGFSLKFGVDARLIMAIVLCESGFNPKDTSRAGARGLGQLMPDTARELGVSNIYDTNENLYGTVRLLRSHLDKYGQNGDDLRSLSLALAAYNAGPGAVKKHGGIPPYRETQNYVQKVIRVYRQICGT